MPALTTQQAEALIAALTAGQAISRQQAADLIAWGHAQPALRAAFDDSGSEHHATVHQWHDLVSYLATDHPQAADGRPQPLSDPDQARLDDRLARMSQQEALQRLEAGLADPLIQSILADRHHHEHRQLAADWSRLHSLAYPGSRDEDLRPVTRRDPSGEAAQAPPEAGTATGARRGTDGPSPADAAAAIAKLDADPDALAALQDPLHPRHAAARAHRSALFDAAFAEESPDA